MVMTKILVALCVIIALSACVQEDRFTTEELFDDGWHFVRIDGELAEQDSLLYILGNIPRQAEAVLLPHTPRIEPLVVNDQWQGSCFYFKTFEVAKEEMDQRLVLRFDGAMNIADVWVNGKWLKRHLGGYLPFEVVLNPVLTEGANTVVVCLDNRDNATTGPKPLAILDFNTYGGLYRHVWLQKNKKAMITRSTEGYSDAGVLFRTLNINSSYAEVSVQTDIRNLIDTEQDVVVDIDILDDNNFIVAQDQVYYTLEANGRGTFEKQLEVDFPELWSPANPNLYTLRVSLSSDGELLDRYEKKVGIRTLKITNKGLYINGEQTFLRGCNRYQEYPYVGYAISDKAQWRDAWNIKSAGMDYVRCAHYPPSEAFLEACDAYGIMVLDAILGMQYFGDKAFEAHALQSAKDMIRRDRNHPSILAWELSIDEAQMPKSFTSAIAPLRDREAPGTYTAGCMKDGYDIYLESRQNRKEVDYQRPLIVSEYGDWEYYSQDAGINQEGWMGLNDEERNSRQPRESGVRRKLQQVANIKEAHEDNVDNTHAIADGYWVMYDYNRGNSYDLEYSGICDIFRLPKYSYYYFAAQRGDREERYFKPVFFVANDLSDSTVKGLQVYTNVDSYRIEKKSKDKVEIVYNFDGTDKRYVVHRAGEAAGVVVRRLEDGPVMPTTEEVKDVEIYYADIVDSRGTVVTLSDDIVEWVVSGDAHIVSPDEGKVKNMQIRAVGGTSAVVIESYGKYNVKAQYIGSEIVSE